MELLKINQSCLERRHIYDTTKQLSLADIFESDKPQFLTLLKNHIDLDGIVLISFYNHYYTAIGRNVVSGTQQSA